MNCTESSGESSAQKNSHPSVQYKNVSLICVISYFAESHWNGNRRMKLEPIPDGLVDPLARYVSGCFFDVDCAFLFILIDIHLTWRFGAVFPFLFGPVKLDKGGRFCMHQKGFFLVT